MAASAKTQIYKKTLADTFPVTETISLVSAISAQITCSGANGVSYEFLNSGDIGNAKPNGIPQTLFNNSDGLTEDVNITFNGPAEVRIVWVEGTSSGGGSSVDISNRYIGKVMELINDDGGIWNGYPFTLFGTDSVIVANVNGEQIKYELGADIQIDDDNQFQLILNSLQSQLQFGLYTNLEELLVNSGSNTFQEVDFIEINADVGTLTYSPNNFLDSPEAITSILDQMNERQKVIAGHLKGLYRQLYADIPEGFPAIITRPTDYFQEVAQGRHPQANNWNKFGFNDDVDAAAPEIIASFGGTFNIMTAADTLSVVSTSVNDAAAGTGARSVLITGINASAQAATEIVTLNGTTPVNTITQFLGVNRVVVLSSGTSQTNEGVITLADTAATVGTQAQLPIGGSVTQQAIFHTQIGYNFNAYTLFYNVLKLSGSNPVVTIKGYSFSRVTLTRYLIFKVKIDTSVENTNGIKQTNPFTLGGQEVLYFTAETNINDTVVDLRFSGVEEKVQ